MANLKPIVTTVLLLIVIAFLFFWSYSDFKSTDQIGFVNSIAAASGVALLLSVLKVWQPRDVQSSSSFSGFESSQNESKSVTRKRWTRK